jgi:hypothetical protein
MACPRGVKNITTSENETFEIRMEQQHRNTPTRGVKASTDRNASPGIELAPWRPLMPSSLAQTTETLQSTPRKFDTYLHNNIAAHSM